MTLDEFKRSLTSPKPPVGLSPALQALWCDARGDWREAHRCAQDDYSRSGALVHGYLHRKEGDLGNAGYWYARAKRPVPPATTSLAEEWEAIVGELLVQVEVIRA